MTESHMSLRRYFAVFGSLLALTVTTTAVARVDLGDFNVVVALLIAVLKALLVVLFFMHLVRTPHRTMIVAGAGVFWLAILIVLTLGDVLTRGWLPVPNGW
jgi:cytochrome c oxidase subunit IV